MPVDIVTGPNSFDVRSLDAAGNETHIPFSVTFHDVTPPSIQIQLSHDTGRLDTDARTSDPRLRALIEDASSIAQLKASINGRTSINLLPVLIDDLLVLDQPLLEQLNGAPLEDGHYRISIDAEDSVGNTNSNRFEFDLDTIAYPANISPDLLSSSDAGSSAFDNVTNVTAPTVRLFAERGAFVRFYVDGVLSGEAYSMGMAMIKAMPLADGIHQVAATVEDFAGNVSGLTPPLEIRIDTLAPTIPVFQLDDASRSHVNDGMTTAERVTLVGHTDPGSIVRVQSGQQEVTADVNGNFTLADVSLAPGENDVVVVAGDVAGNESSSHLTITRGN